MFFPGLVKDPGKMVNDLGSQLNWLTQTVSENGHRFRRTCVSLLLGISGLLYAQSPFLKHNRNILCCRYHSFQAHSGLPYRNREFPPNRFLYRTGSLFHHRYYKKYPFQFTCLKKFCTPRIACNFIYIKSKEM